MFGARKGKKLTLNKQEIRNERLEGAFALIEKGKFKAFSELFLEKDEDAYALLEKVIETKFLELEAIYGESNYEDSWDFRSTFESKLESQLGDISSAKEIQKALDDTDWLTLWPAEEEDEAIAKMATRLMNPNPLSKQDLAIALRTYSNTLFTRFSPVLGYQRENNWMDFNASLMLALSDFNSKSPSSRFDFDLKPFKNKNYFAKDIAVWQIKQSDCFRELDLSMEKFDFKVQEVSKDFMEGTADQGIQSAFDEVSAQTRKAYAEDLHQKLRKIAPPKIIEALPKQHQAKFKKKLFGAKGFNAKGNLVLKPALEQASIDFTNHIGTIGQKGQPDDVFAEVLLKAWKANS